MGWVTSIKEATAALTLSDLREHLSSKRGLLIAAVGACACVYIGVKILRPRKAVAKLPADELAARLSQKRILIVGGTAGCGRALALSCLERGSNVTFVGRREPDALLSKATFAKADLSLMRSARALAQDLDLASFDIVVFTVGTMAARERQATSEGVEWDMAVSFLCRLAIASQFQAKHVGSKRSDTSVKPRIFVMGFPGWWNSASIDDFNCDKSYGVGVAHMNTVVANEALVDYLDEQLGGTANVYGLNPGMIHTEIRDQLLGKGTWTSSIIETMVAPFCKSAEQYSERTLVHLMVSPELENKSRAIIDCDRTYMEPNAWLDLGDNRPRLVQAANALLERALNANVSA